MAEAPYEHDTSDMMDSNMLDKVPTFEGITQMNSDLEEILSTNVNTKISTKTFASVDQIVAANQSVNNECEDGEILEGNNAMEVCEALKENEDAQSNGMTIEGESETSLLCKLLTDGQSEEQIEQVFNDEKLPSTAENESVDVVVSVDPLDSDKSLIDPMEDSNSTVDPHEDEMRLHDIDEIVEDLPKEDENDVDVNQMKLELMTDDLVVEICHIEEIRHCFVCERERIAKYTFTVQNDEKRREYVCEDKCYSLLKEKNSNIQENFNDVGKKLQISKLHSENMSLPFRKCAQCVRMIKTNDAFLLWAGFEFCKEHCLYRYHMKLTKKCSNCTKLVESSKMGKYLVRFGKIYRQFCSTECFRLIKQVIQVCSYCQSSISWRSLKKKSKCYCNGSCLEKYERSQQSDALPYNSGESTQCFMCEKSKTLTIEFSHSSLSYYFCTSECFIAFKFINNLQKCVSKCHTCSKYLLHSQLDNDYLYIEGRMQYFCTPVCRLLRISQSRVVTSCVWCKARKCNDDLIMITGYFNRPFYVCSLHCLNSIRAGISAITNEKCVQCAEKKSTCEISSLDGKLYGFCSATCLTAHQSRSRKGKRQTTVATNTSLLSAMKNVDTHDIYFFEDDEPPEVANKMTSARCISFEKESQITIEKRDNETQTDLKPIIKMRTLPVPIYIPHPVNMWHCPLPRAVPFPFPIPIPLLVPLLRDSSTEYLKTLKREPVKPPSDPFEAELLMMAELVAAEKPKEDEENENFSPEGADNSFNDDMLQMALKMATDYPEPAVDLEGALTANTITPGHHQTMELTSADDIIHTEPLTGSSRGGPGRGRGRGRARGATRGTNSRRGRGRPPAMQPMPMPEPIPQPPPPPPEPIEKPDANMCLKFTFGVNAWKQWVTTKNSELERSSRKLKLFKTDLLQMTADELNYSMCLFVNEVRKPNGTEYAPDTIYYLCLGIQQYLYESGRIDNIFCDTFYDRFTDCLDDVCSKFSSLYSDSHYIVTRVEEEHLWESKQLGAHSPFVLLTTLMFFNTKHFNLTSVEEHMQLSFSHIMKHWKRNPHSGASRQTPAAGRNVLLRFYPPQNPQEPNARKRKVYEQQENEDNPLRCPVKLYEFYLSKCPESVKTRNDVFYLLPERSCVPESPVWYSTQALEMKALRKMLHRVKMVKEINVALLTH